LLYGFLRLFFGVSGDISPECALVKKVTGRPEHRALPPQHPESGICGKMKSPGTQLSADCWYLSRYPAERPAAHRQRRDEVG